MNQMARGKTKTVDCQVLRFIMKKCILWFFKINTIPTILDVNNAIKIVCTDFISNRGSHDTFITQ